MAWLWCSTPSSPCGFEDAKIVLRLCVQDIKEFNQALRQLKNLQSVVTYRHPRGKVVEARIVTFSDALFYIGYSYSN